MVYNTSSICANRMLDKGETDVDRGGHCPPCENGKNCSMNEDCLTGFCYNGICIKSTCSDGLLGPGEEKVDCGGSWGECPWIKITKKGFVNETLQIVVINPRDGLVLIIKDTSMNATEFNISGIGRQTYYLIKYKPEREGLYHIELKNYAERYIPIRKRSIIEQIPEDVRSLLVPLLFGLWLISGLRKEEQGLLLMIRPLGKFHQMIY